LIGGWAFAEKYLEGVCRSFTALFPVQKHFENVQVLIKIGLDVIGEFDVYSRRAV
jgi:hypothetical protein